MDGHPSVRANRDVPFITICEPRPEHSRESRRARRESRRVKASSSSRQASCRSSTRKATRCPWDGHTLGEIGVRGNVVMAGYYRNPEATAAAMGDGWFHTGDAAVVHPDGYAEIRDRLKDVIISGGENISSVEVEAMLMRHPAVREAAVVGLPDARWGEAPHAFIVLESEAPVAVEELREFPRASRALQDPSQLHLRSCPPENRDGQDPEIRSARGPIGHRRAMTRQLRQEPETFPARCLSLARITTPVRRPPTRMRTGAQASRRVRRARYCAGRRP